MNNCIWTRGNPKDKVGLDPTEVPPVMKGRFRVISPLPKPKLVGFTAPTLLTT